MTQELNFSGKTVLVVGGSSGIGNAIAQAFLAKGASVHVWGTRADADAYADSPDSNLAGLQYEQVDLSDSQAIENCLPAFDSLDVLVLSQGIVLYDRAEFQPNNFRKVIEVNLNSLMDCCARFHHMLKASAGSVIVISSSSAFHSTRGNPAYGASKTGAMGLTRNLADAWAADSIRVNGIAPGMVPTKMTKATTDHPKRVEAMCAQIPLGRLGRTEEVAGVALFLASPLASYVIGQTIPVDGGLTLR
ncbi:SDR family NAD(P)-dependent oxidoreductase [Pseudomonas saliphila]|uniref:SDR family NAD(P)-dependent oxidoreductase n=1 Tax=Pseudomonas saliphila TaxID=2586906 RepID=UPI001239D49D|nr:SDR family oxidoreductase [Pseudomonas saliphila]